MNILILNWKDIKNPDVGGAEIIVYEFAKRLVREGHSVTWFCRMFKGAKEKESIDGVTVIRRGNMLTVYVEAYFYYRSLTVKPDRVVDCVNTICWQTSLYVPHEKRIMYVNQLAREVFFYELPPIISHIAYLLEALEFQTYRTTRVFCYADSVKADLVSFGLPAKNIQLFSLGLDHARYKPGIKSPNPLFVFVARLAAMKRPDLCVEAMNLVVKKYPKAKLAIVGYGPMEEKLQKQIQKYSLATHVKIVNKNNLFFKASPKDQKVKLMQSAWALLLPSVKEGWGLVVTEAGASGTPTIGTRVSGLVDSIVENTSGFILEKNPNAKELASSMVQIIENAALRKKLSEGARKFASQFTWERSYEQFRTLLIHVT